MGPVVASVSELQGNDRLSLRHSKGLPPCNLRSCGRKDLPTGVRSLVEPQLAWSILRHLGHISHPRRVPKLCNTTIAGFNKIRASVVPQSVFFADEVELRCQSKKLGSSIDVIRTNHSDLRSNSIKQLLPKFSLSLLGKCIDFCLCIAHRNIQRAPAVVE